MPSPLINTERLSRAIADLDVAALLAISPENTHYLSSVFIRTQVSIRDRIAVVLWPEQGDPTFLVCDIEESLARAEGSIEDVRTYVEFADSPVARLADILRERGLARQRLGVETKYLSVRQMEQLCDELPGAEFVPIDEAMARVRAVKTPGEIDMLSTAYLRTEEAIRRAWAQPSEGCTEREIANRMGQALFELGSDGVRHMTLSSGPNTIHPHMTPGTRQVRRGDTVLTDVGGFFSGFASDMARMGVVGGPTAQQEREYALYRSAYIRLLHAIRPGMRAADAFNFVREAMREAGYDLGLPHVGHGLSRRGGHEFPMLQPRNDEPLEPGMVLAVEPGFKPRADQRYHIEDLVVVTETGSRIVTDWRSTEAMLVLGEP